MSSLKHLVCAGCAGSERASVDERWSPHVKRIGDVAWGDTDGVASEVIYLNFIKVMENEVATDILRRCVRGVLGASSSFATKLTR